MFNTSSKRVRQKGEVNNGERIVETAGYISRERRIKSMIAAGIRLEEMKKQGAFDLPEGVDVDISEMRIVPGRGTQLDLADASEIINNGNEAAKRIIKADNERKAAEAAKKNKIDKDVKKVVEDEPEGSGEV